MKLHIRLNALWLAVGCLLAHPSLAADPTPQCANPNILVLFDASGSMGGAQKTPPSKYDQATSAVTSAVTAHDNDINFGLLMFPAPDGKGCQMAEDPQIPIGPENAKSIYDLLDPNGANFWGGPKAWHDTPMVQALDKAAAVGALSDPSHRSYLILITDGVQDCCPWHDGKNYDYDDDNDCAGPDTTALDPTELEQNTQDVLDRVSALAAKGVHTFVIGFGSKVDPLALNKMAKAGQTAKAGQCNENQSDPEATDNCFYNAADQASIESALGAIAKIVQEESCDGLDNDCDGDIDEEWPTLGETCDGPDGDKCSEGTVKCSMDGKQSECVELGPNYVEACDGKDNDCDGSTDEDWPELAQDCDGDDADQCAEGKYQCAPDGQGTQCVESGPNHAETCDNKDNDCDTETDEGDDLCLVGETCEYGECKKVPEDNGNPEPEPSDGTDATDQDEPELPDVDPGNSDATDGGTSSESSPIVSQGTGGTPTNNLPVDTPPADDGCGCTVIGSQQRFPGGGPLIVLVAYFGFLMIIRRSCSAQS